MAQQNALAAKLQSHPLGRVLVTGGSGGLANQILMLLSSRQVTSQLHSVDLREPVEPVSKVQYHCVDLTNEGSMRDLLRKVKPTVVIHCASPRYDASVEAMQKVNIEGTRVLVDAAEESGVAAFVYTSSASVISDGRTDLKGANETYPLVTGGNQPEFYVRTKALAETYVLSRNRPADHPSFVTCALRPSGIFGVGDSWVLPGILEAYDRGQTKVQLGDNNNLFEFTENTNVAHAHHLAAAALLQQSSASMDPSKEMRVDGEAFFITNDEPIPFWDFTRLAWKYAGDKTQPQEIWIISRTWAMVIAGLLEWICWLLRLGDPPLTRQKVRLSCMTRYYSVEKAKHRLGYRPLIGVREGLRRGIENCLKRSEDAGRKKSIGDAAGD
ncbi:C-3 sterol dehydrogenase C-4 decarboxylase family [Lecanosticta acicola]|uniref:C-3 sterol dehydrogenase C-4 decarboxylase family n=1 Tax=Lecanosticta acicola TaxID=111012 RepID=A0AAI8Z844_9PEZI|nr:C-3 sterol dehydrogenase C-4 decarboxylase family [Lecanosticta acicola]